MSRHGEIIETETTSGKQRHKIIETSVDGNLTVIRRLVPIETEEDEVPMGATLLDERESAGILARSEKTEKFQIGDQVRRRVPQGASAEEKEKASTKGTIDAILKSGKFRVKWDSGQVERVEGKEVTFEAKELTKVW